MMDREILYYPVKLFYNHTTHLCLNLISAWRNYTTTFSFAWNQADILCFREILSFMLS